MTDPAETGPGPEAPRAQFTAPPGGHRAGAGEGPGPAGKGSLLAPCAVWLLTRVLLLLCVLRVVVVPGPDVTTDVSVIYQGWFDVLKTGTFPLGDVTWQYPPGAALAVLSPGLLPQLGYAEAFFVLVCCTDAAVLAMLLHAGRRPGGRTAGAWAWVAAVPLLGPTAYARYDLMVTAVAVGALLAAARHPRWAGMLTGFGALLKAWPVLLLAGVRGGRSGRRMWLSAAVTAAALLAVFAWTMPGSLLFLRSQRDRGTEVESLGALVLHLARHFGWDGEVLLHYGSVEFLGPGVGLVSGAALALSVAAFGWLAVWRLRAREFGPATLADTALTAVLLFVTTSRVISPQYMIWLAGTAAVCLSLRAGRQTLPSLLVLAATGVTFLEFPLAFGEVVGSTWTGIALLAVRNGLLVAASWLACHNLWRATVPGRRSGRHRTRRV